jgi:hypothetical protein
VGQDVVKTPWKQRNRLKYWRFWAIWGVTFARLRGKASTNTRRRPLSPAGGGKFCYLKVQNGHFPYRFEVVILTSKNQKDAHLKMRSIAPIGLQFGQRLCG